jgi:hypothetical protein
VLDSGDLLARDGKVAERAREATEIKGELILKAVAHSGIDAMTPGDGDVVLGLDWLIAQTQTHGLPYVCANLKREGEDVFPGWKMLEVGEVKVGVFGITGNLEDCEECEVTDATAAATAAVAALQKDGAHQIIALSHQGVDDDVALADAVPGIDFVIAAHSRGRMRFPRIAGEGATTILQAGSRGRDVGRMHITFVDGAKGFCDAALAEDAAAQRERTAARVADLEQKVAEADASEDTRSKERHEKSLTRTLAQYEQYAIADVTAEGRHPMTIDSVGLGKSLADDAEVSAMVAEAKTRLPEEVRAHRGEMKKIGEFAGSSDCRGCHQGAYRHWRLTAHARAYTALVREEKGNDPSCFGCHVTGYHLEGGPRSTSEVSYLRNVQCEACHGPSAKHVADSKVATPFKGRVSETCDDCHNDKTRGGKPVPFTLAERLEKIACDDSAPPVPTAPIQPVRVAPLPREATGVQGQH